MKKWGRIRTAWEPYAEARRKEDGARGGCMYTVVLIKFWIHTARKDLGKFIFCSSRVWFKANENCYTVKAESLSFNRGDHTSNTDVELWRINEEKNQDVLSYWAAFFIGMPI